MHDLQDFRDDVIDVELGGHRHDLRRDAGRPARRVAPPSPLPPMPAIADADRLDRQDEYAWDPRPAPVESDMAEGEVDRDDMEWASHMGLTRAATQREGAAFTRISRDVFVISVTGGQFLHEDRHLADIPAEAAVGLNEHSWYLVVEPSEDQLLLVEVAEGLYEHLPLTTDKLLYMNTVNRHMVSRRSPNDMVVLVQVSGYGPDDRDAAVGRIAEVLAARPDPIAE